MKFLIRDDDLNYFSSPEDIKKWYSFLFEKGISAGFSTIPFVWPRSDVYTNSDVDKEYSIGENQELVDYVKTNPLIEILQHGCCHITEGENAFEYLGEDLYQKTFRGKQELEKVFGRKMEVFVPPHDSISNKGIKAIERNKMHIVRGKGMKNILFRPKALCVICKMIKHKLMHPWIPPYPKPLSMGKYKQAFSVRVKNDNFEELKRMFYFIKKRDGVFIITNHLHFFNEERLDNFMKLISLGEKEGVEFTSFHELFK